MLAMSSAVTVPFLRLMSSSFCCRTCAAVAYQHPTNNP